MLIRDRDIGEYLELFLISCVSTILAIRAFLALSGYPQLGGNGLHIAHMLWGGLIMLVALIATLSVLNVEIRKFIAILTGIGFGTFIDELGKFITSDNDYFFQPTIALLYAMFIGLFILLRIVQTRMTLSKAETTINIELRRLLQAEYSRNRISRTYFRIKGTLAEIYKSIAQKRFFGITINILAIIYMASNLLALITRLWGDSPAITDLPPIYRLSSIATGLMIASGVLNLMFSRVAAYRWFQRGILISIFVTQIFVFYYSQLWGITALTVNILLYLGLRYIIEMETQEN